MRSRSLLLLAFSSATLFGTFQVQAQPVRVERRGHDPRHMPPPNAPTEAPPPPREEHMAAGAGFEWIPGRWDWRMNKWEWMAGRWEKEHPGQHWAQGHW